MNNTKHTQLPWDFKRVPVLERGDNGTVFEFSSAGGSEWIEKAKANREMILKAVNCHDDLIAALQGMLEWARRVKGPNPGPEIRNAHVAIEKASAQ